VRPRRLRTCVPNRSGICIAKWRNGRARLRSSLRPTRVLSTPISGSSLLVGPSFRRWWTRRRCAVPFGFDALVAVLSARHGEIFWVFPPIVTAASLVGAALTYWVGRAVGDAGLPRLVPARHLE